ncbi:MAG TPA: hypothetical protein VMY37_35055 [Thermoguttaceae bacterium]|nr:hypothetical protein [Thermoguttaceae bacterium]
MGYALLWLEVLAGELLLLATLVACIGRIRWRWLRTGLLVSLVVVAVATYVAVLFVIGMLKGLRVVAATWGGPVWPLMIILGVAAVGIALMGGRRTKQEPGVPGAATWPLGKLAVALVVVFALNLMTFWNLDAAVKQRVAALRIEAGALALSVAPPSVPDRDNAAVVYEQAFERMGSEETWEKRWIAKWTDWVHSDRAGFDPEDAEMRELLDQQAPTLSLLRGLVDKPACYFRHDYARPSMTLLLPEMVRIRHAARLVALDARSQIAAGEIPEAVDDVNALFAMAEHAGTVPILVVMLVSGGIENLAVDTLEELLACGQASREQLARIEVPDTLSYRRLFDRAMHMEEAFGLSIFYEYGAPMRLEEIVRGELSWMCIPELAPLYRVFLLDDDAALYREIMRRNKQLAARPFYESARDWKGYSGTVASEGRGLLTHVLLPALEHAAQLSARFDARHRLARLAVAVSLDRDKLAELPSHLPPDPFDGKPLKWKQTDDALVLYSVGPDRVDNGGEPIDVEPFTGDIIFRLPK